MSRFIRVDKFSHKALRVVPSVSKLTIDPSSLVKNGKFVTFSFPAFASVRQVLALENATRYGKTQHL